MSRFLFINPPLVLEDDFIDYPYFANHGLLACAGFSTVRRWQDARGDFSVFWAA